MAVSLLAYGEWNGWNDANGDVPLFIPMVLIVAAVSAATAPAAIMGIVHEYRARGPLTTVLLGVVALDDGLTILIYSFALTAAQAMLGISAEFSWQSALMVPAREIGLAVGLGVAAGFSLSFATRWFTQRTSLLAIVLGVILFLSGCAISLHVSALLANMVLGFVVVNCLSHSEDLFSRVEAIEEPIFGLFFSLAGAHLDLALLTTTGGLAVVITLARFGGKLLGAQIAASLLKAPRTVRRYLGLTLLPQAGVTIGLILHARGQLVVAMGNDENLKAELGYLDFFVNAVLASVVINELITPFLLRFALMQSGDANHQSKGLSDELA
ncbi:MAG: cation:proton antiporter [Rubripirellula sp.]|nr:cation:proton antiporter [Rubripirellula sp.]